MNSRLQAANPPWIEAFPHTPAPERVQGAVDVKVGSNGRKGARDVGEQRRKQEIERIGKSGGRWLCGRVVVEMEYRTRKVVAQREKGGWSWC